MGIALLAFSSLSHPVKALTQFTQWFARPGRAMSPAASAGHQHATTGSGADAERHTGPASVASAQAVVAAPASANAASISEVCAPAPACVVPMTKVPATANAAPAFHPLRVQSIRARLALPPAAAQAANAASFHGKAGPAAHAAAAPSRRGPVLRVLRRIQVADPTRLVLSGRMADVCAELDRLAASESSALTAA